MNAETIAHALKGRKSGKGWLCKCVSHEDKNPSLWIADGHSTIVVKCHAGCDFIEISTALRNMGLWPDSSPKEKEQWVKKKQQEEYDTAQIWISCAEETGKTRDFTEKESWKLRRMRQVIENYERKYKDA